MNQQLSMALALLGAFGGLLLASLAVLRGRSALSLPLALLSLDQFAWNCATLGWLSTGDDGWRWVGSTTAPMFVPFAFHFVIAFIGRRQQLRAVMYSTYALFGIQGVCAAIGAFHPGTRSAALLSTLTSILVLTAIPVAVVGTVLVALHFRAAGSTREKVRAALLVVGLLLMTGFASTDLLADLGWRVPSLSNLGSCAFNLLMAVLAFRMELMAQDQRTRTFTIVTSGLIAAGGTLVALLSFKVFTGQTALITLFIGCTFLVLMTVTRRFTVAGVERQEQLTRVANLGRFSAQMAHDLKNPLAAAQGAIQFLQEEHHQQRSLDPHADFLQVIAEQLQRVTATVDRYQRLSKVEPHRAPFDVNQCVQAVLSLQAFANAPSVKIEKKLAANLPPLNADIDLVGTALENLVKNAVEAMPPTGGNVVVATALFEDADGPGTVLSVTDTGPGMDSRTRERAFDPFFTTKATGSGLGLAWVREVTRAHQGEAVLISDEGKGTRVEMRFWHRAQEKT